MTSSSVSRDLFEIENARNLSRDELVATFVPQQVFWRLLSSKNQIILGSRGSGKTALAKMLSHDHLARLQNERAQEIVQAKAFIGIYVPTSVEWVGSLKNKPWQLEADAESFFQWRLNLATCAALIASARSCIECYTTNTAERLTSEALLSRDLAEAWVGPRPDMQKLDELRVLLEDIEYQKQQSLVRQRICGATSPGTAEHAVFDMSLFAPLKRGIALLSRRLDIPASTTWLVCIDEAEFLEPFHQRILNTHLRADSGNLKFKIATMPYRHLTLETNTRAPLAVGHDFEYAYIDQEGPLVAHRAITHFARALFRKRADASGTLYRNATLDMLGESELIDNKMSDWRPHQKMWRLLERHASPETVERAKRIQDPQEFMDQIGRKIHGPLLLREAVTQQRGHSELTLYSGWKMVVRCTDGNPRRMVRLFNALLLTSKQDGSLRELTPQQQTKVLREFSKSVIDSTRSEPEVGPELYRFIMAIGGAVREYLIDRPLTTDQLSSVYCDDSLDSAVWRLVETAVGLGLLYPVTRSGEGAITRKASEFRLAYVLAPHFTFLPRRGSARNIRTLLPDSNGATGASA